MDWRWTGMLTMMCKADPIETRTCMIDADPVPIAHVSGILQIHRLLHEMIMLSMLGERYVGAARWHVNGMLCVESWKLSLLECLNISIVRLQSTAPETSGASDYGPR